MPNIEQIKKLREETGVSVSECKNALDEVGGDIQKAKEVLRKRGKEIARNKSSRGAGQGLIASYIHPNKKIGVLLELRCESDFVAKSDGFQELAKELCLQIAAMEPVDTDSLLQQSWIKDESKTVKDLIEENVAKIGENIVVKAFVRYEI